MAPIDTLLVLEAVDRHWPKMDTHAIATQYGWPEGIVANALARIREARQAHAVIMRRHPAAQPVRRVVQDVTGYWMGDPPPGRSALDQMRAQG